MADRAAAPTADRVDPKAPPPKDGGPAINPNDHQTGAPATAKDKTGANSDGTITITPVPVASEATTSKKPEPKPDETGSLTVPSAFTPDGKVAETPPAPPPPGKVTNEKSDKAPPSPAGPEKKQGDNSQGEKPPAKPENHPTSEKHEPRATVTDKDGTVWSYTADGKPSHAVSKDGSTLDYAYNKDGKLDHTTHKSSDGMITTRTAEGLPIHVDHPNKASTDYKYSDEVPPRLLEINHSDGTSAKFIPDKDYKGVGHWEKFEHGVDKGKLDSVHLTVQTSEGPTNVDLTNRTLTAWDTSRLGTHATGTQDESNWVAFRDKTYDSMRQAMEDPSKANDPQTKQLVTDMCKQISNLPPNQKQEFLSEYKLKTGKDLETELHSHHYDLAEGYLKKANAEAGTEKFQAIDSVQRLEGGQKEAAKTLRESLSRLNKSEVEDLEKGHPPMSEQLKKMHDEGKLSNESYQTALLYLKNPTESASRQSGDFHLKLADIAINSKVSAEVQGPNGVTTIRDPAAASDPERLELLREALGPQKNQAEEASAQQARTKLEQSGALGKLPEVFAGNNSEMEAADLIKYGHCSLATRIKQNGGAYDNQDTVKHAVTDDMSASERAMFGEGRRAAERMSAEDRQKFLADPKSEPKVPEKDENGKAYTPEEKKQIGENLKYYRDLHNALEQSGGTMSWAFRGSKTSAVHQWEDIAEHGHPTLEGQLAGKYGMFQNGSKKEFSDALNNMSREDFKHLQEDPLYREQIKKTLADMVDGGSGMDRYAIDQFQRKIDGAPDAKNYEAFTQTGLRNLPLNPSAEQLGRALGNMNLEDHKALAANRDRLAKQIEAVPDELQREALKRQLDRLSKENPEKSTHPPKCDSGDQLLLAASDFKQGKISAAELRQKFTEAGNDPNNKDLFNQLRSQDLHTPDAKSFDASMRKALGDQYDKDMLPTLQHANSMSTIVGHNTIDNVSVTKGGLLHNYDVNFNQVVSELQTLAPEERARLLKMQDNHDQDALKKEMPNLTDAQRDQVMKILANPAGAHGDGNPVRPEDMIHMYVQDKNARAEDIMTLLAGMPPAERNEAARAYANKYDSNMLEDLSKRAPDGVRPELMHLASPDMNKFSDAMTSVNAIDDALRSGMLKDVVRTWDGSGGRLDTLVKQLADENDPAKREEIKKKLATAITDEKGTSKQVASAILDGLYVAAAIASAPADAVLATALKLAAAGAVITPAVQKGVQGKEFANGGQDTGTKVAIHAASGAVGWGGAGMLNEGVQKMLNNPATRAALEQMVAKYGADRATEALATAVQTYLENQHLSGNQATGAATQAEARKYAEAVMKGMVKL